MMKFIHRDQAVIKGRDTEALNRKAERGMGADQNTVGAVQKRLCAPIGTFAFST